MSDGAGKKGKGVSYVIFGASGKNKREHHVQLSLGMQLLRCQAARSKNGKCIVCCSRTCYRITEGFTGGLPGKEGWKANFLMQP